MKQTGTVYVVDDDEQVRNAALALVGAMGVAAEGFASAEDFLKSYAGTRPACLVTDVRMLGMSGLQLQEKLTERGIAISVVVLTAYASTPLAVRAMRSGALTLLEKPCDDDELWNAVREGLEADRSRFADERRRREVRERLATLTPKEREVFQCIVVGDANKVSARKLGVSVRTIEIHRRKVFEKTGADSVAELVRMALAAEEGQAHQEAEPGRPY
ncbi:MAG: response regulator [Planctomycetota bacterium]